MYIYLIKVYYSPVILFLYFILCRHEFLNHYLGGGTIFMKAKRSLTNSFDQLLKRKGSKDDFGPIMKEFSLPANALLCKVYFGFLLGTSSISPAVME